MRPIICTYSGHETVFVLITFIILEPINLLTNKFGILQLKWGFFALRRNKYSIF